MVLSARHILRLENNRLKFDELIMHCLKFGYNKDLMDQIKEVDCRNLGDSSGKTLLHYAIQYGNVEIAEYLINSGLDINHCCKMGNSPLLITLFLGSHRVQVVARLIRTLCIPQSASQDTADVLRKNIFGTSPLSIAANQRLYRNDSVVLPILQRLVSVCNNDEERIAEELLRVKCSLRRAVHLQNPRLIKILIDERLAVNEQDPFRKRTALHDAVRLKNKAIASLLVESQADVSITDIDDRTPLAYYKNTRDVHDAYKSKMPHSDPEFLRLLIKNSIDLTSFDRLGYFQISSILSNGTKAEIEILLMNEINFFASDKDGQTVVHLLSHNTENVAEFLMTKEFPLDVCNKFGFTPLFSSVVNGNVGLVELLLNRKANPMIKPPKSSPILFRALPRRLQLSDTLSEEQEQSGIKIIELLLQYGVDIQSKNSLGQTVFHLLSDKTMPKYVEPLIAHFALDCSRKTINNESIMTKIGKNPHMKKYYDTCVEIIFQFRSSKIFDIMTKWDILIQTELKLFDIFMKHPTLIPQLQSMLSEGDTYYDSLIKKKIQKYLALQGI